MNCAEMRQLAAAWENGDALTDAQARSAADHAAACGACRSTHPVFLALAPRDSGTAAGTGPSKAALALADRVMAGIESKPRALVIGIPGFRTRRSWSVAAAAALAACALFVVGIVGRDPQTVEVRFVLDAPAAKSVFLAGDFSSWDTKGLELRKTEGGVWERKVRLRRGQSYTYNFIVDGTTWVVDPAAPERVDDGFGGESALMHL